MSRLVWIVVLIAGALLVLPLYVRWFFWIAGSCGAAILLERPLPRVG